MTQIITAIQEKGGTGKTTMLCMLATFLAEDGARVVIVDTDPLEAAADFAKHAAGDDSTIDYMQERDENAFVKKVRGLAKGKAGTEYDVILVDTAGIGSRTTDWAVQLADLVLVPVKPARADVKGLLRSLKTVESVSELAGRDIPAFAVLSDVVKQAKITQEVSAALAEKQIPLFDACMYTRTGFREFMTGSGRLTGNARSVGREVLAEMQIRGLLDYYGHPAMAAE